MYLDVCMSDLTLRQNPKFSSRATLCLNIWGVACIVEEIKFMWCYEENLVQKKIPGELSRATVCTFLYINAGNALSL